MSDSSARSRYLFTVPETPALEVHQSDSLFPVGRIFCVGRNYEAHAREMGMEVDREAPFYFTKPASAAIKSGTSIPYPPGTQDFQYEMELVVALGADAFRITVAEASQCVYGYACGLDLTRRDLQKKAREKGRPWDLSKAFENSAVLAPIVPVSELGVIKADVAKDGMLKDGRIELTVNGEIRQEADLSDLIWSAPEIIADLSQYYHLRAGDLIYTGTPAGVGPLSFGDEVRGSIEGLVDVTMTVSKGD